MVPGIEDTIELHPNGADPPNYAHILRMPRRTGEAMRQVERAVAIDPLKGLIRLLRNASGRH